MKRLRGIVVPIVTPFDGSGRVDTEALKNLCDYLLIMEFMGCILAVPPVKLSCLPTKKENCC